MAAHTLSVSKSPIHRFSVAASVMERMEGWLGRSYDALAARHDRQESAALLSGLDERMLADIGYGPEDSQRIRMG